MKSRLLDCTLRDGGFLNDWRFGRERINGITRLLAEAGLDVIEVGFLDAGVSDDADRSILPDMAALTRAFEGVDKRKSEIVAMIDFGTCGIEKLLPADESFADGIRLMFKREVRREAAVFCAEVKAKGYRAFAQPVSATTYSEEELRDLAALANEAGLDGIYIVDTYGLLHRSGVREIFDVLDGELDPSIALGYHGHNNFQMAYANSMEILERETTRDVFVDGSLAGRGKTAELSAMYMNEVLGANYDLGCILEAIEEYILPFGTAPSWGYQFPHFVAAAADCHPNYVAYYRARGLPFRRIYTLLCSFEKEERLRYNELYAKKILESSR